MEIFYTSDFLDLLQSYIDENSEDLWKTKPFVLNNKSVFVNDHEILFFDNIPNLEFEECIYEKKKRILDYISFEPNFDFVIDKTKICDALLQIPLEPCYSMVGNDIECEKCNGSGEVEWKFENYTDDFDCPVCKGDGLKERARKVPNGKFQRSIFSYIQIGESFFNVNYIEKLVKISIFLNEDIKLVYQNHNLKANYFKIGLITVLIMPCHYDVSEKGLGGVVLKLDIE